MMVAGKRALALAAALAFSLSALAGPWQSVRATRIVDSTVVDNAGQTVGEVHELIVDMHTGRLHYAVLELGGFLGLGERLIPYPLDVLSPGLGGERVVLDVKPQELAEAGGFAKDRWPAWTDPIWDRADARSRNRASAGDSAVHRQPRFLRTRELLGRTVEDRDGKTMGRLEDIVLDLEAGFAREALVAAGQRPLRVPFRRLHTQTGAPGQPLVYEGDR